MGVAFLHFYPDPDFSAAVKKFLSNLYQTGILETEEKYLFSTSLTISLKLTILCMVDLILRPFRIDWKNDTNVKDDVFHKAEYSKYHIISVPSRL